VLLDTLGAIVAAARCPRTGALPKLPAPREARATLLGHWMRDAYWPRSPMPLPAWRFDDEGTGWGATAIHVIRSLARGAGTTDGVCSKPSSQGHEVGLASAAPPR
jgi:hypothetical protein